MAVFIFLIFGVLSATFGIIGLCGMFIAKGISQVVNNTPKGKKEEYFGRQEGSKYRKIQDYCRNIHVSYFRNN